MYIQLIDNKLIKFYRFMHRSVYFHFPNRQTLHLIDNFKSFPYIFDRKSTSHCSYTDQINPTSSTLLFLILKKKFRLYHKSLENGFLNIIPFHAKSILKQTPIKFPNYCVFRFSLKFLNKETLIIWIEYSPLH